MLYRLLSVINVRFSSDSYSVIEGEQADVCLTLESGQLNRTAEVLIASQSDSSATGDDYNIPNMFYITLKPGHNQTCFSVATLDDNLVEGEETFQLTLSTDDHAVTTSSYDTVIVHIEDNDSELIVHKVEGICYYDTLNVSSCCVWFGC